MGRGNGESTTANAMTSRHTNVTETDQRPVFVVLEIILDLPFGFPINNIISLSLCCISHSRSMHAPTCLEVRVHTHQADRTQKSENLDQCKDNKHGKHAQTERSRRHGQGTCRQLLCRRRLCCRLCLWKHAQCSEQSTCRWIVCGSPGLLPCSTGWQPLRVRCLSLSCLTTVACHRYARTRPVLPWALPCGASEGSCLQSLGNGTTVEALSPLLCAQVEAPNLGHQRNATLANGGKQP